MTSAQSTERAHLRQSGRHVLVHSRYLASAVLDGEISGSHVLVAEPDQLAPGLKAGSPHQTLAAPEEPPLGVLEVTSSRLARIDRAETAARAIITGAGAPVTDLRVRDLGAAVRVEVPASALPAVRAIPGLAEAIGQAGFADLPVEYAPFSSGSVNKEKPPVIQMRADPRS